MEAGKNTSDSGEHVYCYKVTKIGLNVSKIGESQRNLTLCFHYVLAGIQIPQHPSSDPLAGHVSSLSLLISSPKPVLSPSVGAWKVNVQCFIMTFDNLLSSHCVPAATLGAVRDAEMNGPQHLSP